MVLKKSSKEILYDAFCELVKIKDLKKITVEDISECSGISRSTFYRYFADKYDLMCWGYTNPFNSIFYDQFGSTGSIDQLQKEISLEAARNIYNHQEYFSNIYMYEGQNSLRQTSHKTGIEYYTYMLTKDAQIALSEELIFAIKFYVFGVTQMLFDWIGGGFRHTPEEHVRLLQEVMPEILQEAIADIDRRRGVKT